MMQFAVIGRKDTAVFRTVFTPPVLAGVQLRYVCCAIPTGCVL